MSQGESTPSPTPRHEAGIFVTHGKGISEVSSNEQLKNYLKLRKSAKSEKRRHSEEPPLPTTRMEDLEARNAKVMAAASPVYERINAAWAKAEAYIQKLGVLAPVMLYYDHDMGGGISWVLSVQKRAGKWRICHGMYDQGAENRCEEHGDKYEIEWTAISDCNVELRVEMSKHLEELILKVVETNEHTIPDLQMKADVVEMTLKKLGIS